MRRRKVRYAVSDEVFPIASSIEPNLGRLSETELLNLGWGRERRVAQGHQRRQGHQNKLHDRILGFHVRLAS